VCVLISAGVTDRQNTKDADAFSSASKAKVSAFHTRNAVLVFAVFGLFLILVDTILHVTSFVNRLPFIFHKIVCFDSISSSVQRKSFSFLVYYCYDRHGCDLFYTRVRPN